MEVWPNCFENQCDSVKCQLQKYVCNLNISAALSLSYAADDDDVHMTNM